MNCGAMFKPVFNIYSGLAHLMRRFMPTLSTPLKLDVRGPFRVRRGHLVTGRYGTIEIQSVLRRMTNWQLSQWQRAGRSIGASKLEHFAMLPRRNHD
ncbi:hypothetical protein LCGC14_2285900 [marine sediment metagenome]|uniref:Uncharacterized protein n=1 Tax=marine sediment metagenome TaxID=412755 RepID=A0A0F9DF56_9ZZZZ